MNDYLLRLHAFLQWCKINNYQAMAAAIRAEILAEIRQRIGDS